MRMPLLEYFVVVGAALTAALFVAEYYVPAPAPIERSEIDKTSIRIHSTKSGPEKIELIIATIAPRTF